MEHIFEAFQNSFSENEKVNFIANVKDETNEEGDLMITSKRLIFYPAKPKSINDVMFINVDLIDTIKNTAKGIEISSNDKKGTFELEYLKEELIQKLLEINHQIQII
nr:hypothetical protein [uncultured Flavobacterium sp.]